MNSVPLDLIEVPEVMRECKRGFENFVSSTVIEVLRSVKKSHSWKRIWRSFILVLA